jgi:hypothetical protein
MSQQQETSMEHCGTEESWEGPNYMEKYLLKANIFTTNLTQTAFVLKQNTHYQASFQFSVVGFD